MTIACTSTRRRITGVSLAAFGALAYSGCISTESDVLDVADGCPEFGEADVEQLDIDPSAKDFVSATVEVTHAIDRVSEDVLAACAAIATDLGEDDTWSEHETMKARISNDADTGACDVALLKIDEGLTEASRADVDLQVAIAKGECHVPFDAQTECDAQCASETTCEAGSFESRCEPGDVTAICDGECVAGAFCVGTAKAEANCMGHCEATCVGACAGTCKHADGTVTENDPNCNGICASTCNGKCQGRCEVEVEAGLACGAGVYCRGGCEGVMESPACVTQFDPPECEVNTACYESCTARLATEHAVCMPSSVSVVANVEVTQDFEPLIATLNANLPTLVAAAEAEGKLFRSAGRQMTEAGRDLNERIEDIDGKSLACVGVATTSLSDAVDTISVSVEASLNIQSDVSVEVREQSSDPDAGVDD